MWPLFFLLSRAASICLAGTPSPEELAGILKAIDDRQTHIGDQKSLVFIDRQERDKSELIYQAVVYRRDADDKLVILFLKPDSEAGKGYLRIDANLFIYDPQVGKWERRTEREHIGGTDSLRSDYDQSRLAEEYTATYVGEETLGSYTAHHLKLAGKPGVDVPWPTLELWTDTAAGNLLKRQDFAESGRLMRTTYYRDWRKVYSDAKKADIYYPHEVLLKDEIEVGNVTRVVIQQVDLSPLDDSIFTKAWLESRSR